MGAKRARGTRSLPRGWAMASMFRCSCRLPTTSEHRNIGTLEHWTSAVGPRLGVSDRGDPPRAIEQRPLARTGSALFSTQATRANSRATQHPRARLGHIDVWPRVVDGQPNGPGSSQRFSPSATTTARPSSSLTASCRLLAWGHQPWRSGATLQCGLRAAAPGGGQRTLSWCDGQWPTAGGLGGGAR